MTRNRRLRARLGRRSAVRLALASTLVGGGGCLLAPAAGADSAAPSSYQNYLAGAMAPVYQISEDAPNATFHPQGEGEYNYTLATAQKATAYALAAAVWPGSAAGNAGTLASVLGVPGQTSALNDPARAEASSGTPQTSQSVTTPTGTETSASVVPDAPGRQNADARTQTAGGGLGAAGSTGASTSSSSIRFDPAAGTLTSRAVSHASDISMAGGLVSIGSVTSAAGARSTGAGPPRISGATSVGDMRIAGQAAYVDGSGVHLGRPGQPAPPAVQSAVNQALHGGGMSIYFTSPHQVPVGGVVYYYAASILFYWLVPGDPSGDSFTLSVGGSAVSMGVTAGSDQAGVSAGGAPGGTGAGSAGGSTGGGPGGAGSAFPSGLASPPAQVSLSLPSTSNGAAIATSTGRGTVSAGRTGQLTGATTGLPSGLGAWVILVLLGGLLGALALPRVPALFAGPGAGGFCPRERSLPETRPRRSP